MPAARSDALVWLRGGERHAEATAGVRRETGHTRGRQRAQAAEHNPAAGGAERGLHLAQRDPLEKRAEHVQEVKDPEEAHKKAVEDLELSLQTAQERATTAEGLQEHQASPRTTLGRSSLQLQRGWVSTKAATSSPGGLARPL